MRKKVNNVCFHIKITYFCKNEKIKKKREMKQNVTLLNILWSELPQHGNFLTSRKTLYPFQV